MPGAGRALAVAALALTAACSSTGDGGAGDGDQGVRDAGLADRAGDAGCEVGIPWCDALRAYYEARGGAAGFSAPYHDILDTSVLAWVELEAGDAAAADRRLKALWQRFPRGSAAWGTLTNERGGQVDTPPGLTVASMLARLAAERLARKPGTPSAPLQITVPIAACSRGVVPASQEELTGTPDGGAGGQGTPRSAQVDPALVANDHAVLRQSLAVFQAYVEALFGGHATAEVVFVPLPAGRCFDVRSFWAGGRPFSQPTGEAMTAMLDAVPPAIRGRTDWWLLIYPTLLPDDPNNFDSNEWVTGGSTGAPGGAVLDFTDDQWFLRQPPHFVSRPHTPFVRTPYQPIERFFYLPRWLDHETHHHLFGADFPELKLEDPPGSHSWFDRSTWPNDFVGRFEPDYFDQADFLRFQTATPPIWVRARWGFDWSAVTEADLAGRYEACRQPGWSDTDYLWNKGSIALAAGRLTWTNDAGVAWHLATWRDDATLAPGQVLQVDGPYAGQRWTFAQGRDPASGGGTGVVTGFEGRARCPVSGCRCP